MLIKITGFKNRWSWENSIKSETLWLKARWGLASKKVLRLPMAAQKLIIVIPFFIFFRLF